MRGMILAAGRGERMGVLTAHTPKPLLRVGGHYLIEYAIASMQRAGIHEIVINIAYHAEQIKTVLGEGSRYGVSIFYSEEKERLEVGGGIFNALPLLGEKPFIVMSSDIITDYPLAKLPQEPRGLMHVVMVDNPPFHPQGDFGLRDGYADQHAEPRFNYSGIAMCRPQLFAHCKPGHFRWSELIMPVIQTGQVTGEHYQGMWYNIGTPDELESVNQRAREDSNLRPLASETNTLSN